LTASGTAAICSHPNSVPKRRCFGVFERKERWCLSLRGWLLLLVLLAGASAVAFFGVHPFLAVTDRLETDVLVVEGWVHESTLRTAAVEFKSGSYRRVFTTGGPVNGTGPYVNDFNTTASVGADGLKAAGVPAALVQMVPSRVKERDRTFSAAVALHHWLREHQVTVRRINVVTEDVHGRRSRLLFQKAFGKEVDVGIISAPSAEYPGKRWWRYSEGVKEVISEAAAYIYARFFFWPAVA